MLIDYANVSFSVRKVENSKERMTEGRSRGKRTNH